MNKTQIIISKLIMVLFAFVCVYSMIIVNASNDIFDITLQCATSDGSVIMDGETFRIYKIADENSEIVSEFKSVEYSDDEATYASNLSEYVKKANIKPLYEVKTDKDGLAQVELERGLFLVIGDEIKKGDITYTPVPYTIELTADTYSELVSYVKYISDEPKPEDPSKPEDPNVPGTNVKTGDEAKIEVVAWIFMGSIFAIAGICFFKRRIDDES